MGFPRILSKNNKIYTKLGDFCLSVDGNHFWIVCHTCQEELQTQDHFWKHIQDEHNFLHGLKQETRSGNFSESDGSASLMPLPLYRKIDNEQSAGVSITEPDDDSDDQQEPKDYTEMRVIEPNDVDIEIKVEPPPSTAANVAQATVEVSTAPATIYQLPQVPPPLTAAPYTTIVHTTPTINMSGPTAPQPVTALLAQELPKDSNSTTASASSAVSSDDGERWYICDYDTCGLKFKYQSRLELHRSVHSKERRFACELCGCAFKQSCNLSTHRKKKHFLKGTKTMMTQHQTQHQPQPQQQELQQHQLQQQRF